MVHNVIGNNGAKAILEGGKAMSSASGNPRGDLPRIDVDFNIDPATLRRLDYE